jgi:methylmalonyl-CoA mutase N-terminal domain/subunit
MNNIQQNLNHAESVDRTTAYKRLRKVAAQKAMYSLDHIRFENGYAIGSDGNKLTALKLDEAIEAVEYYPALTDGEAHASDKFELEDETVEVKCDHKHDKTGTHEADMAIYPDVEKAIPETSESLTTTLHAENLIDSVKSLIDSGTDDPRITFEFVQDEGEGIDEDSGLILKGENGFAVVMPIDSEEKYE